ncbi:MULTISPECIES: phosphocholine-specific phospholipase C [unclassified Streptomyces]|uniref:phosphocholine-specific phospholipase C n=1 Tax=unclassified Streptomyces TaxID=2593676 RepID=UPI0033FA6B22
MQRCESLIDHGRRDFLKWMGGTAALSVLGSSIARAAEIDPHYRTGTVEDVEHIVILMQENRSFDHYLGTLRGVRGFGDPRPWTLPSGAPVWRQEGNDGVVLPYRPAPVDGRSLGLTCFDDIPHDWNTGHRAWNGGRNDGWVKHKGYPTMTRFAREDVPFHHQLANTFTICDAYHCSLNGWTDPNRYYMWTGCVDDRGRGGGPIVENFVAATSPARNWPTYPERLQRQGVSWKIYQDIGLGLTREHAWGWVEGNACIGNYGDNSLLHFKNYQQAKPGSPLYDKARTGTQIVTREENGMPDIDGLFSILRRDVKQGTLPQVSWIAAPEIFNEHPFYPANYGAWYVAGVIDALTADPRVWSKTALIITYDENGGFFDHVPPPYPPENARQGKSTVSVAEEHYHGPDGEPGPYGLGPRVPTFVASPWSRGGWVCSEVFDHTSLIRFIERRFGVREEQITKWRRAVCGDLTSAFDFTQRNNDMPPLPSTRGYRPPRCEERPVHYPQPDDTQLPEQEKGLRRARALPYDVGADARVEDGRLHIDFRNDGGTGAVFHVASHSGAYGPWTYTLAEHTQLTDSWPLEDGYNMTVHGPNGFFRQFTQPAHQYTLHVTARSGEHGLVLEFVNHGSDTVRIAVTDAYQDRTVHRRVPAGRPVTLAAPLADQHHWYDLTVTSEDLPGFRHRLCGHVETGQHSTSDPAFGHIDSRAPGHGTTDPSKVVAT